MRLILGVVLFLGSVMFCVSSYASANSGRFVSYPQINGFYISQLCDAGEDFRTSAPVLKCKKWELVQKTNDQGVNTLQECVGGYTQVLQTVSKYHIVACDQNSTPGCEQSDRLRKYGNTFQVPVYELDAERGELHIGDVNYTIPACK